jgi:hypothetical protein
MLWLNALINLSKDNLKKGVDFFIQLGTSGFENKVKKAKKITQKPLHNPILYFYICTHTWSNAPHTHTTTPSHPHSFLRM